MSFLRPQAQATLLRWREVILALAGGLLLLGLLVRSLSYGGLFFPILYGGLLFFTLVVAYLGWQRSLMRIEGSAFGHVVVDERQITYFLNGEGWPVSINDLENVQIATTDQGPYEDDVFWQFKDRFGTRLVIPASAEGADSLPDALSVLKGVKFELVIKAMSSVEDQVFTIWEKS